jgi:putative transposase
MDSRRVWNDRESQSGAPHHAATRLLSVVRKKRRRWKPTVAECRYPNLLKRNFRAVRPNEKWVTDITYIRTRTGWLYLSVIKDLHDAFIVGYQMSRFQDFSLVDRTLDAALKDNIFNGSLLLHSDQGCQYTSHLYKQRLNEYGITPSTSRAGTPLDNTCVESFFGILKTECIYVESPQTAADAEKLVDEYIHYCNYERIQLKTGRTPYAVRTTV